MSKACYNLQLYSIALILKKFILPLFFCFLGIALASPSCSSQGRHDLLKAIDEKLGQTTSENKTYITHYSMPLEWLKDLQPFSTNLLKPLLSISIHEAPWSTIYNEKITDHIRQSLRPKNFFVLDDIIIGSDVQKKIFGILNLKEIDDAIIANHKETPKTASDLKKIIEESKNKLLNQVIGGYWDELGNILSQVTGLEALPGFMEKEEKQNHTYFYLLGCIRKAIIYEELNNSTNGRRNLDTICENGFFDDLIKQTGVVISINTRREIFNLLTIEEIANSLLWSGFYKRKEQGITKFISTNNDGMQGLWNQLTWAHWKRLSDILAKVEGLKAIPRFMKDGKYCTYFDLRGCIHEVIIYEELIKATNGGNNFDAICPDGFFTSLKKKTSAYIGEEIQRKIFKLLKIEEITNSLVSSSFHEQGKEIKEFISTNQDCRQSFCDKITNRHWNDLGKILAEIPGLEALTRFMEVEEDHHYYKLLGCIRKAKGTTSRKEDVLELLGKLKISENRSSSGEETDDSSSSCDDE